MKILVKDWYKHVLADGQLKMDIIVDFLSSC